MSFSTIALTGSRVLVKGQDIHGAVGETVVSSAQWEEINAHKSYAQAQEEYADVVDEFFKPLLEAAEKAENAVNVKVPDPLTYVVLTEGEEGKAPVTEQRVPLTKDSQILRLLEQGNTDRLIWVAGDLEIADTTVSAPAPAAPSTQVDSPQVTGNADASL